MQPRDPAGPAAEPGPLDEETHARVLDHQPSGMIQGISEKGLHLVRIRSPAGATTHQPGTRVELESVHVLGRTRHRGFSPQMQYGRSVGQTQGFSHFLNWCLTMRSSRE